MFDPRILENEASLTVPKRGAQWSDLCDNAQSLRFLLDLACLKEMQLNHKIVPTLKEMVTVEHCADQDVLQTVTFSHAVGTKREIKLIYALLQ